MRDRKNPECCQICGRRPGNQVDPLSEDCDGDCWGSISKIEVDIGNMRALANVRKEFLAGLRLGWAELDDPSFNHSF